MQQRSRRYPIPHPGRQPQQERRGAPWPGRTGWRSSSLCLLAVPESWSCRIYCPKAYWANRVNGSGYNPAARVTNTATPRATACALVMDGRGASPGCLSQACTTMPEVIIKRGDDIQHGEDGEHRMVRFDQRKEMKYLPIKPAVGGIPASESIKISSSNAAAGCAGTSRSGPQVPRRSALSGRSTMTTANAPAS